jgi:dinuclear metal center YbgI/SA1388 family protein
MATPLADILAEADSLLEPARFEDYAANGLQVAPARAAAEHEVTTIVTGVSAQAELFEQAAAAKAQLVLVHHGLFWGSGFRTVDATLRRRLQLLLDGDIALAAYHLPLDAQPELGNNALLARELGATATEPFGRHRGTTIGFLATFPDGGIERSELLAKVTDLTERDPLQLGRGPSRIERLAIVSGAGSDYLDEAAQAGAQALLTGEPAERATAAANELGILLIAAGHYATETLGIQHLGEHLAERFGLEHVFIDVPNPV